MIIEMEMIVILINLGSTMNNKLPRALFSLVHIRAKTCQRCIQNATDKHMELRTCLYEDICASPDGSGPDSARSHQPIDFCAFPFCTQFRLFDKRYTTGIVRYASPDLGSHLGESKFSIHMKQHRHDEVHRIIR